MAQYNDDYVHDRINRLESIIDNELKPRIQTLETNLKYTFENTTKLVQQHEQVIKNQSALLTLVREILENQQRFSKLIKHAQPEQFARAQVPWYNNLHQNE